MADIKNFLSYVNKKKANKVDYLDDDFYEDDESLQNDDEYDEKPYVNKEIEDKIKKHRKKAFITRIVIIALIALGCFLIYYSWRNKSYTDVKTASSVSINESTSSEYIILNNSVVTYSKDGMACYSVSGDMLWNRSFGMQAPMYDVFNDVIAIADYNGQTVYIADSTNILGEVSTNLPIKNVCVASTGVVSVVLDDVDVTWIYLYDYAGKELVSFKTTMNDSGYPLAVSLSKDATKMGVSFLNRTDTEIKSVCAFYNFGDVGQNMSDNYASGFEYPGCVIPTIEYTDSGDAFAISSDRVIFFKGGEIPEIKSEVLLGEEEVKSVFYSDDYLGLVFPEGGGATYRIDVYNMEGALVCQKKFSLEYTDIVFGKNEIIMYNDTEWQICTLSGKDRFHGVYEDDIYKICPIGSMGKYVIVSPGKINVVELR